jgi:hypothetical protein
LTKEEEKFRDNVVKRYNAHHELKEQAALVAPLRGALEKIANTSALESPLVVRRIACAAIALAQKEG